MAKQVISERVVSEKIVGGGGIFSPITKRFSNLSSAIAGLCIAPLLIIFAVGVLVYGENFSKSSEIVRDLDLIQAEDATQTDGLIKIQGEADISDGIVIDDIGEVLYYSLVTEEFREVEKTETETITKVENGQEIEQTVERQVLVEEWERLDSNERWAGFMIGDYEIKSPEDAKLKADLQESIEIAREENGQTITYGENTTPRLGDVRTSIEYLGVDGDYIVIGEVNGDVISSGGDEFLISNYTDSELVGNLENEENTLYWVIKFIAFGLMFAGITSIMQPIVALADFIPFAGKIASTVAGVIGFILSLIIVAVLTIVIKLWWLAIICGVLLVLILIGVLIFVVVSKKDKQ